MDSGNLKNYKDPWVRANYIFETDYPDNLSALDLKLNEFTTQYLAWKNLLKDHPDDEWVQFSHYRRWLKLPSPLDETVELYVNGNRQDWPVERQFKLYHPSIGWDVMEEVMQESLTAEEAGLFDEWKAGCECQGVGNLMATRLKTVRQWWEWGFPKIMGIYAKMPYDDPQYKNSPYQSRAVAFLGERLFGFWVYLQKRHGMKVQEVDVVFRDDMIDLSAVKLV